MMHRPLAITILALSSASVFAAATAEPTKEQTEFFENKIRPIFKENCYKCHSLEQGKSKGDLTLDTKAGLLKGGENGAVVVPGDIEKSALIKAVGYLDKDLQMPPKGEKLTNQQIADLTTWVKMGAPDPRKDDAKIASKLSGLTDKARSHYAYQPVTKPAPPAVKNSAWPRTAIDNFILAKLESKGMIPAGDATKETLLRRATYDLTGLPPTPPEVQAFVADTSPQAFAKVVDRLLASPAYGERWGRHWLDTARYSDTTGGDKNQNRRDDYRYAYAWTYRDWVIKAINDDMPYNQFIIQQLAADKLPNNPAPNLAALGFLTVGERFRNPNDIINDRIDTVTKGFLGLTVACARCHDHMFDPIPTKDYYALHGVFASTVEPADKPIIGLPSQAQLADYEQQANKVQKDNRDLYYSFIDKNQAEFFKKIDGYLMIQRIAGGYKKKGAGGEAEKERIALLQKYNLDRELLPALAKHMRGNDETVVVPFRKFAELSESEFTQKAPEVIAAITSGGGGKRGAAINPIVVNAFKDAHPASMEDVTKIYKDLFASLEPQRKAFIAANAQAMDGHLSGFEPALVEIFQNPFDIMPASQLTTQNLREFGSKLGNKLNGQTRFEFSKLNELELTHPGAPARAMLVADAPQPKNSSVFIRGQQDVRGDMVPRHFLEVLSPDRKPVPFKEGSGRLELAEDIASKSNPLTARVIVNRVWMHHFGEGFVRTLDDLGTQSETPSHPELFDFLASYFMDQGWSLKKLHKAIMLSHVYQESSQTNAKFEQLDPDNRLLWRANVRRLDFEALRDSLLVMSGKLDRTVGGKPVNLTEEPYSFRRSVYGYIDRGNLPELMQQFDFSDPDMPNSKRASTTVPQQALFLMNSAMSVDVARHIMARPEVTRSTDGLATAVALYNIIFQRNPQPIEIQIAMQFVAKESKNQPQTSPAQDKGKTNTRLAGKKQNGGNKRYDGMKAIQNEGDMVERKPLTPWETYAQALLFSNEASYVN
ncbi:MAG: PSD1 and planctomycete cytochrome C domain-containing protein [Chthoniobacter sp.]|uniref:PSD1 and planctomycete cytochrome C domain-containing protein n=1 Tax=Chthoniobacter sp. TaxID=2510640 RepID=UPI0032A60A9A